MKITDIPVITSKDNSKLKLARSVRDGRESDLIFVEGVRLVEELLRSPLKGRTVFASESAGDKLTHSLSEFSRSGAEINVIASKIFDSITDTKNSQGIVVLADRPQPREYADAFASEGLLVFLHQAGNPSNLGAIIRTAEAAGARSVLISPGSADAFSPKSLRSSMGSAFRQSLCTGAGLEDAVRLAKANGYRTIAADIGASRPYTQCDLHRRTMLVFGSEAHGLDRDYLKLIDEKVFIPMENGVESLNLAVSAGILLFEAKRQRDMAATG